MSNLAAEVYPLTLYRSYGDMQALPGLLIGKINTKGTDNAQPPRQILGYDIRMSIVSASIDNAAKVYPGMKVFVIKRERDHIKSKAALIIAEGEIDSISDTVFSGRVAKIKGQFSMVSRQYFIAVAEPGRSREGDRKDAETYLLEAERHRHENDLARSAQKLQHARELEPNNPLINLRYAQLALKNGAEEKARAALKKAFGDRRRLEDVNDYLILGALYLRSQVTALPSQNKDVLKTATLLLSQMRQFEKDLGQFGKDLTPPKASSFRYKHSRFTADYHLNYGILLRAVAATLREYNPAAISKMLEYAERDALYAPIETRVGRERVLALPRKQWDRAYTDAAITHFELALKKDRHSEAAYELIDLCDSLWEGSDNNRRALLKEMIERHAPAYLEAPHEDQRMSRVRRVLNKVNQA
ncbi:MAG: tetratricopeptide repeat protein [Leptospiraceae bacterium]|nr:tetratricopeptide repeat protein [Leptospiraceae bacterium]